MIAKGEVIDYILIIVTYGNDNHIKMNICIGSQVF